MELSVKLEAFEGPLDLLLHLLEKNKVNIYDIPIVEITNQYLDYIRKMEQLDLNIMSEFLLMAATLLRIKSKMLLPDDKAEDEDETDPRAELVEQLLQYKMYKYISYELKDRRLNAGFQIYRQQSIPDEVRQFEHPVDMDELTKDLDLRKLDRIFQDVMKKQADKVDPIRSKFGKIELEEVSLESKIAYLEDYASAHRKFSFVHLLEKQNSKMELIVTFLAVLELMKYGKIHIFQENLFDDIYIESRISA